MSVVNNPSDLSNVFTDISLCYDSERNIPFASSYSRVSGAQHLGKPIYASSEGWEIKSAGASWLAWDPSLEVKGKLLLNSDFRTKTKNK